MVGLHCTLTIPQDLVHGLHNAVRRQATVLLAQVHAATGGVHPDAQILRGGELCVQQPLRLPLWENVMVVKAGGAAVFHQLPHAGDGAVVDHPAVQILPDLVQGLQPVEQLQILHLRQVTAEGLVQMVMGVDEAGIDDAPGGVDDLLRLLFLRADVGDDAVLHQQIAVGVHGVAGVAGDDVGCVFHQ